MKQNTKKQAVSFALLLAMTCTLTSGAFTKTPELQAAKKATLKTKKITVETGKKKTIKITGKKSKAVYSFKASNKKLKSAKRVSLPVLKPERQK